MRCLPWSEGRALNTGCFLRYSDTNFLNPQQSSDGGIQRCVLAELFLEGQPLFELSQLLAYRRGQYDPSQHLEKIPDPGIRKMILHMIQLDPESRLSAESYMQNYASVFPTYFSPFLHKFFSCLTGLDYTRVAVTHSLFHEIHKKMMITGSSDPVVPKTCSSPDASNDLQQMDGDKNNSNTLKGSLRKGVEIDKDILGDKFQLVGEISSLLRDIEQNNHKAKLENLPTIATRVSDTRNMGFAQDANLRCEGMVLIASLLCSCLRSVKQPQLRRWAVLMLKCLICVTLFGAS